tara:strand:+ start:168 stop:395 length:228 start_codon:yes stop_codon:yes gene_type:complete
MNIEFDYKGTWITNPHLEETGRFEVIPEEYYGEAYKRAEKEYLKDIIKLWLKSNDLTREELDKIIHFCNGGDAIH